MIMIVIYPYYVIMIIAIHCHASLLPCVKLFQLVESNLDPNIINCYTKAPIFLPRNLMSKVPSLRR